MLKEKLLKKMVSYQSSNVFNPYANICPKYDIQNADKKRLNNLKSLLDSFNSINTDFLLIGRDLGYKGGRRTGIAFTDEYHLEEASNFWKVKLETTNKVTDLKEMTATTIWSILHLTNSNIFTWNIFPFHPHLPNSPFSNRCHTAEEREYGGKILEILIELLNPKQILAIGNDAYNYCSENYLKYKIYKLRHPSYGGTNIFKKQIKNYLCQTH